MMGLASSPSINRVTRMEPVRSVISKHTTQAFRRGSSRCSTLNTSPSTTTLPMSRASSPMGTGFFFPLILP